MSEIEFEEIEEKYRNSDNIRMFHAHTGSETEHTSMSVNWLESKSKDKLKNAQLLDPVLKLVLSWKADNKKPDWSLISHLGQDYKTY